MNGVLEILKNLFPIEVAIIAAIFIYLLWLFKGIAEKLILIANTQTQYIQDRLSVVEKYLGIDEKIIALRDKHIEKLEVLAKDQEEDLLRSQVALAQAKEQLWNTIQALNLRSQQVDQLQEAQNLLDETSRTEAVVQSFYLLQTQLQAVISLAENLKNEIGGSNSEGLNKDASELLNAALMLKTSIMNFER